MSAGDRQAGPPAADLYGAGASPCPVASPLAWSVDDADGWLQGPLDLAYLGGHGLSLTLRAGQAALLVDDGRVLAAYGAGTHDVATSGDGPLRLLFFAAGPGPQLRWRAEAPLIRGDGRAPVTGAADLDVTDPVRFFETFVAGGGVMDLSFVLVLVDRLVQDIVAGLATATTTPPRATDLEASLAPCGLACRRLALQDAGRPAAASTPASAPAPVRS